MDGSGDDLEHRVLGRGREQFGIGRIGADAVEELTDLPLPPTQVGTEDLRLVGVGELDEADVFMAPADAADRTNQRLERCGPTA